MHGVADYGRRAGDERGMSLVVALMASMLLTALGLSLVMVTNTETMITSNYRTSSEALYAADAGIERAVQDLLLVPDWNRIWNENLRSSFVDASNCTGTVPMGGVTYNLAQMTARLQAETNGENLWGANNPVWAPYACGRIDELLGEGIDSAMYVIAWAADDPSEADGDPSKDTNGVVTIRAEAFGPGGTDKIVEVTVARTSTTEIERGQIAQRGQEELNQRARKAAVQTPGKSLTRMSMDAAAGILR
ncbi:MAG TPA: pilus assembly PilX N-terminal domain-containing protein [Vicinamibacterales bacterium]|nr:pilus assembly PilX N-terminal domain-containing protein [Vicinamibacterales bacterium]